MGSLVDGRWQTGEVGRPARARFQRKDSAFHNWVTADGSAGPDGRPGFAAEPDRWRCRKSAPP